MCGLTGVAGKVDWTHKKILEELLLMSQLRGIDSTGIATLSQACELDIKKKPYPAYEFLMMEDVEKFIDRNVPDSAVVIAHTRAATTKYINYETSHPFQYGHICLAHNGTLTGRGGLKEWGDGRIDSQDIAYNMEKVGEAETLSGLHGAFALTWVNMNELTFNFARNKERPLYFCFSDNGAVMYWASEAWMLRGTLARNNKKIDEDKVFCLDELSWAKFDITATDWRTYTASKFKEWTFPVKLTLNRSAQGATGWTEGASNSLTKARIRGISAQKQSDILTSLGFDIEVAEPMMFMNYQSNPDDESRCTITGNMVAYPGGKSRNQITLNAIIYASSRRVFDAVGQGRYAKVLIQGMHKDMVENAWIIVCKFVEPWPKDVTQAELSAQREDDAPGYDDDVDWQMDMPLIFPNPKKRGTIPPFTRYGYKDKALTDGEWIKRTADGCYLCSEVPMPGEHKTLIWINDDHAICETCAIKHNKALALPIAEMVRIDMVV